MSKKFWIGCDISSKTFWIAVAGVEDRGMDWIKLPNREFDHSEKGVMEFIGWLEDLGIGEQEVAGICLEATGRHSMRWVLLLDGRLGALSIVNPARPKAFGASLGIRDKSDRVDACVCAMFGRMKCPKPTTFRSPKRQALCEQFRCYQALDSQRIANEQRLNDGPSSKSVRAALRKTIKASERIIAQLKDEMDKTIKEDPVLCDDAKQAKTIQGIGDMAVWVIFGEFGDLRQYKRNELVALAGLFPKEHSSGTSVHKKPRLAKCGGGRVRKILYMCAMSAQKHNPHIQQYAARLAGNGKTPMQILGAIMRKLLLLVRAVVVSGKAYDPEYGLHVESQVA